MKWIKQLFKKNRDRQSSDEPVATRTDERRDVLLEADNLIRDVRRRLRHQPIGEGSESGQTELGFNEDKLRARLIDETRRTIIDVLKSETDATVKESAVTMIVNTQVGFVSPYTKYRNVKYCECGYPTGVTYEDGSFSPIYELTDLRDEGFESQSHYCPNCGSFAGSVSV